MSKRDWRLLQAYLATGLTPEQIEELKAAAGLKKEAEDNGSNQHISSPEKIYAIAGALGMKSRDGDDALHDLVFGMTGKQHISGLTSAEAYDVIAELEKKQGFPIPTPRWPGPARSARRHRGTPAKGNAAKYGT